MKIRRRDKKKADERVVDRLCFQPFARQGDHHVGIGQTIVIQGRQVTGLVQQHPQLVRFARWFCNFFVASRSIGLLITFCLTRESRQEGLRHHGIGHFGLHNFGGVLHVEQELHLGQGVLIRKDKELGDVEILTSRVGIHREPARREAERESEGRGQSEI